MPESTSTGARADYRPLGADDRSGKLATLKRTFTEFSEDDTTDWAAALEPRAEPKAKRTT